MAVTKELWDTGILGSRNGSAGAKVNHSLATPPAAGMSAPYRAIERYAELDLTLFVACYNEEQNLVRTFQTIQEAMSGLPLSYEILVIDDASRDQSLAVIKEYQRHNPSVSMTLVENPQNRGLSR